MVEEEVQKEEEEKKKMIMMVMMIYVPVGFEVVQTMKKEDFFFPEQRSLTSHWPQKLQFYAEGDNFHKSLTI